MNPQTGRVAFQDEIPDNHCFGCGPHNAQGLRLKSYWDGDRAVSEWRADPAHAAGPAHILNGGIIATILDCHAVCTAIADAYRREERAIGSGPEIWYATSAMTIEYLRPTPIDATVSLTARIVEAGERATTVECALDAQGKARARASVRAVRVPDEWRHGAQTSGT